MFKIREKSRDHGKKRIAFFLNLCYNILSYRKKKFVSERNLSHMPRTEYLECGKIINTHGVKGVVKAESFCDSPKVLACPFSLKQPFLAHIQVHIHILYPYIRLSLNSLTLPYIIA